MMRTIGFYMLILVLVPHVGNAQTLSYWHHRIAQGLPSDHVHDVVRDSSGFAWIATDRGLVRYDGQRFMLGGADAAQQPTTVLARRSKGGVVFGTPTGIFAASTAADTVAVDRIVDFRRSASPDTQRSIERLYPSPEGSLWASFEDGSVARVQGDSLRTYPVGKTGRDSTEAPAAAVLTGDQQGHLWLLTAEGGLYRFDRDENRFDRTGMLSLGGPPRNIQVREGTLWIAGRGILRADLTPEGGVANVRRVAKEDRTFTDLAFLSEGLLLGTQSDGLFWGTLQDGPSLSLRRAYGANSPHRTVPLPFQDIHRLYVDRSGTVWVGSEQGLGLLRPPLFRVPSGLPNYSTFSVHPRSNGVVVSLEDAFRVDVGEEQLPIVQSLAPGVEEGVTSVAAKGPVTWIGTSAGRFVTMEEGQLLRSRDFSDRGEAIFYIYDDRRGNVWVCQAPADTPLKGVTRIAPDGGTTFYDADEGLGDRVLALREGPKDTVYAAGIGADTYLHHYDPSRDQFVNRSRPLPFAPGPAFEAHDLAIDDQGTIWLGTTAGLVRHGHDRTQRVDLGRFTTTEIRAVETMPNGDLWLATGTEGLLHYRNGNWVRFGLDRGLISTEMMYRTLRLDGQGRLWVGTTAEGVVYSRMPYPTPDSTRSPTLLSVTVDGRPVEAASRVDLSAREELKLRVATLTFPSSRLQYQYRLHGDPESEWSEPSGSPTIRFDRISPSVQHIDIRARNGTGHYWSAPLRVPLRVRPVWYRRWWAYVLFGIAGLSLVGGLVRLYVGRRRAQEALREEQDRLETFFESLPTPVVHARVEEDGQIRIQAANEAFESVFGSNRRGTMPGRECLSLLESGGASPSEQDEDESSRRFVVGDEKEEDVKRWVDREVRLETVDGPRTFRLQVTVRRRAEGVLEGFGTYTDITDQKERERTLRNEQQALQSMYRITADQAASFEEKVERLLQLGKTHLGLPYGYLTQVDDDTQHVLYSSADHPLLASDTQISLSQSYCQATLEQEGPVTVQDAPAEGWAGHPAHEALGFDAYIGATVRVEGTTYGTICFAGPEPRERPFTEREKTFVELMTRWAGYEIEQRRAQSKLQRQNDRLDQFASLVTHDLRNPLNVAKGRLQMAKDRYQGAEDAEGARSPENDEAAPDHLSAADRALDRMDALIEDVLMLTWGRQDIDAEDLQKCSLAALAEDSWGHVDASQATLEIDDDRTVIAHEGRLRRLLENLFRNAVEHGGERVTVRVGGLDGGFYVEDNGPGIPEADREDVFQEGYSSNEEGTGLGLSIVASIAQAHGWSVSVTDGREGGARFDILGEMGAE